jgi:hypothetical protein
VVLGFILMGISIGGGFVEEFWRLILETMGLEGHNNGFYVERLWSFDGKLWCFVWRFCADEWSAND